MANIGASDVTYTIQGMFREERGNKMHVVKLEFGNGVLTYPAGGIPLTLGGLGLAQALKAGFMVSNAGAGYVFEVDVPNMKLLMLASAAVAAHTHSVPAHAHDILLKDAVVADAATSRVNAEANKLGANAGGDITVTGAGANGGVQNSAVGVSGSTGPAVSALAEATGVAIDAQSVYLMVVGF